MPQDSLPSTGMPLQRRAHGIVCQHTGVSMANCLLPSPCTVPEHNIDPRPLSERVSNGAPLREFAASASGRRGAPPTCFLSPAAATVRKTLSFRPFAMDGMAESRMSRRYRRRKAGSGFPGTRSSCCPGSRNGATSTGSATAAAGWTPPRRRPQPVISVPRLAPRSRWVSNRGRPRCKRQTPDANVAAPASDESPCMDAPGVARKPGTNRRKDEVARRMTSLPKA